MKLIKLNPEDKIFDINLKNFQNYEQKLDVMERERILMMYCSQGKEFWLHFILTLRYNYYLNHFMSEIYFCPDYCVFYIIKSIEETFINIHKKFLEDGCDPLKLLKEISDFQFFEFRIIKASVDSQKHIELYEEYIDFIENLIGTTNHFDRSVFVKCTFCMHCYQRFYISLYNLLQRYKSAGDIPLESGRKNIIKQYWQPFKIWNTENFMPSYFEKYLVSHYGEKLPAMLSIAPDIVKIFEGKEIHHFCSIYESQEEKKNFDDIVSSYRRSPCNLHNDCWKRIIHDEDCEEPYICFKCPTICDTFLNRNKKKEAKNHFWKKLECQCFPSEVQGCNDLSIQTEFSYRCIETYDLISKSENIPTSLYFHSPKIRHAFSRFERQVDTKFKLRKKLQKKKKDDRDLITNEIANVLYTDACDQFILELSSETNFEYHRNHDALLKHIPFLNESVSPIIERNYPGKPPKKVRSIGVGYDALTNQIVLQAKKYAESGKKSSNPKLKCHKSVVSYVVEGNTKFITEKSEVSNSEASKNHISSNKKVEDKNGLGGVVALESSDNFLGHSIKEIQEVPTASNYDNLKPSLNKNKESSDGNAETKEISKDLKLTENKKKDSNMEVVDEFLSLIKSQPNVFDKNSSCEIESKQTFGESIMPIDQKPQQKVCSSCGMIEVKKKSFKKCAQCKLENFEPMRYYCSKNCQAEDWKKRHREEHRSKIKM